MKSINESKLRIGNFTSSEIVALMSSGKEKGSFGKPALTYIEECNMERRLGLSLNDEASARPLTWGNLLERRTFELLGLDYILSSTETDQHPTIPYWAGSKDGIKYDEGTTIIDIKCPLTRKSFCQLVDAIYVNELHGIDAMTHIRETHKDGDKFYWQLVSNAVINNAKWAELIIYMPYQSELNAIRDMASNFDGNQNKVAWIGFSENNELPYLIEGGFYKNLNIIRFEVPESDKKLLTDRVIEAGKLLIEHPKFVELENGDKSMVDYQAKIAEGKKLRQLAGI